MMSGFYKNKKIWVAGASGLVGSALCRRLKEECFLLKPSHAELDLTRQSSVENWMEENRPDIIFLAAGKVGGIGANAKYPADFLTENLAIAHNVIPTAARLEVEKLIYLGSSCIYPKLATQPIHPDSLLTGSLEETNEGYALAKIAGVKLCEFYRKQYGRDFISAMPCNLYGPNDRWDDENAHVIPSLLSRFHHAKMSGASHVTLWGDGTPLREFLFVDDMAEALYIAAQNYSDFPPLNIGSGEEVSIRDLACLIRDIIGYKGEIVWDTSKPNGTPRKILDSSSLRQIRWEAKVTLYEGLLRTYEAYRQHLKR